MPPSCRAPYRFTGVRRLLLALGLALCFCLLQSAAEDDWLAQRTARLSLDSPQASYLLARACPTPDFTTYFSFNAGTAGTLLDTVGINAAPAGAWNLQLDAMGQLAFAIYSPQRRGARDVGNGWHRYALSPALRFGQEYNCILECSDGSVLLAVFTGEDDIGTVYEKLPCAVDAAAVYAGDFPGDDTWGAGYNIHSSFTGTLDVLYFGPLIDALSPVNIAQTWVEPGLQGAGQVLVTTAEDAQDWDDPGSSNPPGTDDGGLFTLDYDLAASDKSHYTKGDCVEALLTASPLYGGAAAGPGLRTGEIDRLRQAKVGEVNGLTQEIVDIVQRLQPGILKLQTAYAEFLDAALKRDPSLEAYVGYTLKELAGMQGLSKKSQEQCAKLDAATGDALADANAQYVRLVNAVQLGSLCLAQTDCLCLYATMPLSEYSGSSDPALAQAAAQLDQGMAQYDQLSPQLRELAHALAGVDYGLQQLAAADYYVGEAALEFMAQQLPEAQRQLAGATERPGVGAEQLAQARATLRYNQLMHDVLAEQLARAPKPKLIALAGGPSAMPPADVPGLLRAALYVLGPQPALAQDEEPVSAKDLAKNSMRSLREFADLPKDPDNPTYWESFKQGYRNFSSGVNKALDIRGAFTQWGNALNYGRKEAGKKVDQAGADIHTLTRMGYGAYYGNTPEEVAKDIADKYIQIAKNQAEGREGSETYRTAKAYMDGIEDLADAAAKDFITKALGGTLTPWAAGKIAKGLASVFTGLAKGIYAIADPSSSNGELAVGVAEIVLAGTAGNMTGFANSMAGFKALLTKALGLGSMNECLEVVLDQYKEDLGKQFLGDLIDGKTVLDAFLNFLGVDPKQLEETNFDGNYLGKISGGAVGTIAFTVQGTTWQGSISGSIPWTIEGTEISGTMEFNGSLFGSFNADTGALKGEVSGTAGKNSTNRFSGPITGTLVRSGVGYSASGNWQAADKTDTLGGSWTASR